MEYYTINLSFPLMLVQWLMDLVCAAHSVTQPYIHAMSTPLSQYQFTSDSGDLPG